VYGDRVGNERSRFCGLAARCPREAHHYNAAGFLANEGHHSNPAFICIELPARDPVLGARKLTDPGHRKPEAMAAPPYDTTSDEALPRSSHLASRPAGGAQVSGAQDSLEAAAAVLMKLRGEVAAALEAQQHQRRKQATAVAVRLGRFGWSLINKEGAPFVQVSA
jgi:hypothetical protein